MDRIDFEELALKSMDTTLAPTLTSLGKPGINLEGKERPLVRTHSPSLSLQLFNS